MNVFIVNKPANSEKAHFFPAEGSGKKSEPAGLPSVCGKAKPDIIDMENLLSRGMALPGTMAVLSRTEGEDRNLCPECLNLLVSLPAD